MQTIANQPGGRHYYPKHAQQLPSIFIKEAKTLKRSMIQNKTFDPVLEFPSPIMKGIENMPQLHGYVLTSAKSHGSPRVILRGPDEEQLDPILATWRHGLGRTAADTAGGAAVPALGFVVVGVVVEAGPARDVAGVEHHRQGQGPPQP